MNDKIETFKGYEAWANVLLMTMKMHLRLFLFYVLLCLLVIGLIIYYERGEEVIFFLKSMCASILKLKFSEAEADFSQLKALVLINLNIYILITITVGILYYWLVLGYFKRIAGKQQNDEHISGSKIIAKNKIKDQLNTTSTGIPIGELRMPIEAETKHCFVVGRTGAGKTQSLIGAMVYQQKKNAKLICLDNKGDYVTSCYQPDRDLIFCPVDSRSVQWSLFNDIDSRLDVEQVVCHSLIPDRRGSDPFWSMASRNVLKGVLYYAWRMSAGRKVTNKYIWTLLQSGFSNISKILKTIPEGQVGYAMISDQSPKQAAGVMANLLQDVAILEFMAWQDGNFSVRKWLHDPKPGTLFILNQVKSRDLLKPILTLLIDIISCEIMSMPDDHHRRIFCFLDEFGALFKIPSLIELLTRGRSKGAAVWLGTQDIGQIQMEYGQELLPTIINNCASKIILSVTEPETARYLSDMIGDTEVRESSETHSMGLSDIRDGITLARSIKTKKLILPSELQSLPDLEAIVKFPNFDFTRITIPYIHYPKRHESFILHKDMPLSSFSSADCDSSWESSIYNRKADSPSSPFREF